MFRIYADGQLLYEPNQRSDGLVIGPTCDAEAGLSGQLSFTMLPGHYLYDTIKKLKTEIVATLDGEEIFRGRILNWDIDFYKNKKVHCEGDISYLLDSMQPPHDLRLTITAYFTWMISEHNIQVDEPKRFTIGQITIDDALTEHDFIDASYRDTRESIDSDLINVFGGFLRTRRVGAVTYLDYLKEYTETGEQALEFGSNLIDLTQSLSSDEIFTILLPTGEPIPPVMEGAPSWPLTIESVNNGSKLLENVDAVAQFGRIVRNQFFEKITDAAALKAAGEDFLAKAYKAPFNSYTIQGLDLHLLDATIQQFKVGLLCRISSPPHGIDVTLPIVRIAWDFDNPDATEIVIAPLVRDPSLKLTSNSGGISSTIGQVAGGTSGGRMNQLYKYYTEGDNWAKIQADKINLISGDLASQGAQIEIQKDRITAEVTRASAAEGELSGRITVEADKIALEVTRATAAEGELSGRITVEADKIALEVTRATAAEGELSSRITVTESEIDLRVTKAGVITAINVAPGVVTIDAAKLNITGIVTAGGLALEGDLSATNALISNLRAGNSGFTAVSTNNITTIGATVTGSMSVAGNISGAVDISGIFGKFSSVYEAGSLLSDRYLGKNAKAADSNKLDGMLSSNFVTYTNLSDTLANNYTNNTTLATLLDGKSNTGHSHVKANISDFPTRTSAEFVTGVSRSVTTGNAITAYSAQGATYGEFVKTVTLSVTKNTYYFYT